MLSPKAKWREQLQASEKEVLRQEKLGIHANFFVLGGNSLLATQVVSRVKRAFQMELQIRHLFEIPTIGGLAKKIEEIILYEISAMPDEDAERLLSQGGRSDA